MDVENKGFHSQEGILPCQRNRTVSLFERSPRQSLVRNQDDDKAWQIGRSPLGAGAGVQRGCVAHREQATMPYCLWFLTYKCHGTQATSSNRGHAGSAPSTASMGLRRGKVLSDAQIRCEGSRKTQQSGQHPGSPSQDHPQASEVNRPEPKCHCASVGPWGNHTFPIPLLENAPGVVYYSLPRMTR